MKFRIDRRSSWQILCMEPYLSTELFAGVVSTLSFDVFILSSPFCSLVKNLVDTRARQARVKYIENGALRSAAILKLGAKNWAPVADFAQNKTTKHCAVAYG